MTSEPRPARKRFVNYYEDALQRLVASGITPEHIDELRDYGLLAKDNVTGFWEGRSGHGRFWTLRQAIQHVKETGEQAFYVEMDLQNLGGLNAKLGHSRANEVFSEIATIARRELSAVASEATFFRHGGDETSAFLIDTTDVAVRAAFASVQNEEKRLAKSYGIHKIPHAKYRGDKRVQGTGIHFGMCRIHANHEAAPTLVFREADIELELKKRGAAHVDPASLIGPLLANPSRSPGMF